MSLSVRALILASLLSSACSEPRSTLAAGGVAPLKEALATAAVPNDPDDPAIWVNRSVPAQSLIIATDKIEKIGGLYVFGLDGALRSSVAPLDRPNNVDVEYGLQLGNRQVDIAVVTERKQRRLRIFEITAAGSLVDLAPAGLPVLAGQEGEAGEPMGIALYRRPSDAAVFAIVAPKTGGERDYLWQYRLDGSGDRVSAMLVRRFGAFSRIGAEPGEIGEVEALVVDDEHGVVFYSDERYGIRKYAADPDAPNAATELAVIGRDDYQGDREGLAIVPAGGAGEGYLLSSDQVPGATRIHVYRRTGDHARVAVIPTRADSTDGLDATATPLPGFPAGLLVMMNSSAKNFLVYRLEDVIR